MENKKQARASKTIEGLEVWQKSRELAIFVYRITKRPPGEEKFGLAAQMRRAAISVSSNIAEGFGRQQNKDKEHFYVIASGSLSELLSQLILSNDLGYITADEFIESRSLLTDTRRYLFALLRVHRA